MKNRLSDLNDHLFAQIERLSDEALTSDQIDREASRARAMVEVADRITEIADISLRGAKLVIEHGDRVKRMVPQITEKAPEVRD